jgi:hypothetical protein
LSPRAYRKEITRGVDELTEKVRAFERGEWCTDREPVLKAYAAGLADVEQARQAQAHLSHCRGCSDLVSKLNGHLHDLGGAVLAPTAVDGLSGGVTWTDRLAEIPERARDGIASVLGRAPSSGSEEAVATVASSGGVRGAGVAGAGVLAKVAGVGAAGKVALACVGGSVAATACIAAGVGPIGLGGGNQQDGPKDQAHTAANEAENVATESPIEAPETPSQVEAPAGPVAPQTDAGQEADADEDSGSGGGAADEPADSPEPSAPVDAAAPPETQEFGAPAAAVPTAPTSPEASSADGSGGDASIGGSGGSAVRQEFTP